MPRETAPSSRNAEATAHPAETRPRRRPPQFSIFGLSVLMFVVSIALGSASYMVRAIQGETGSRAVAVLLAVAMPMLVMILLSFGVSLRRYWRRR